MLIYIYVTLLGSFLIGQTFYYSGGPRANWNVLGKLGMKLAIVDDSNENVSFVVGNFKNVF